MEPDRKHSEQWTLLRSPIPANTNLPPLSNGRFGRTLRLKLIKANLGVEGCVRQTWGVGLTKAAPGARSPTSLTSSRNRSGPSVRLISAISQRWPSAKNRPHRPRERRPITGHANVMLREMAAQSKAGKVYGR